MKDKTKPLSPADINNSMETIIPGVIIEAVNNLLKKEFRGRSVCLLQKDILNEILRLNNTLSKDEIFEKKWMDFESIFEKVGWKVEYDKPGYNESYESSFKFTPKKDKYE